MSDPVEPPAEAGQLRLLLQEWLDMHDEPCRLDHHGYCQTHFLESDCLAKRTRAALAAQAVAMREACAAWHDAQALSLKTLGDKNRIAGRTDLAIGDYGAARRHTVDAEHLRALPLPNGLALAAMIAAERAAGVREGMEKAAGIASDRHKCLEHIREYSEAQHIAAAITAAMKDQPA